MPIIRDIYPLLLIFYKLCLKNFIKDLSNSLKIARIVMYLYGEIGEVVNTVDCGSIIQGFDSLISPHIEFYAHLCA